MTRVYVDMVADLFHPGHVNILRSARTLGDHLVVGVHSDQDVASYKRAPIMTMRERADVVAACRYVDEVLTDAPVTVPEHWIRQHRIDLVVHGDDFGPEMLARFYAVPQSLGILRVLPYWQGVSTTDIIQRVLDREEPLYTAAAPAGR